MDQNKKKEGFSAFEIIENSFEGVLVADSTFSHIIRYVNKSWEKTTGWSREEVVGKLSPNILKSGKQSQEFYKQLWSTILADKLFQGEVINKKKDGSFYTAEINIFPIVSESGARWFAEISRNITEEVQERFKQHMQLEQRTRDLEESDRAKLNLLEDLEEERTKLSGEKAKDEAILLSIGDGLVATDAYGKVILTNKMFESLLGWNEAEIRGKLLTEIVEVFDDGRPIPEQERLINKTLKGSVSVAKTTTTSTNFKRRDGTIFPVALTASPIIFNKELIGAVEVFRDITKEKELDRSKSEFISVASHQLRTPLTGIQWVVERFAKKENLTPKGKEYLNDLHTSAKHLTELVDLLLNLSRIEAGKIGITPEPLEMVGFMKSYFSEVSPLLDKKELKLVFEDHPPELAVNTDKSALRNIIQSFISNAIEYTLPGGKIDVAVQKKDDKFMIQVKDTGIGIPKAEQSSIFQKFTRASNAKLYKTDGTGIGLYIAERSASHLGGKTWFESEENKGSTFYVELPLELKLPQKE